MTKNPSLNAKSLPILSLEIFVTSTGFQTESVLVIELESTGNLEQEQEEQEQEKTRTKRKNLSKSVIAYAKKYLGEKQRL